MLNEDAHEAKIQGKLWLIAYKGLRFCPVTHNEMNYAGNHELARSMSFPITLWDDYSLVREPR